MAANEGEMERFPEHAPLMSGVTRTAMLRARCMKEISRHQGPGTGILGAMHVKRVLRATIEANLAAFCAEYGFPPTATADDVLSEFINDNIGAKVYQTLPDGASGACHLNLDHPSRVTG